MTECETGRNDKGSSVRQAGLDHVSPNKDKSSCLLINLHEVASVNDGDSKLAEN